YREATQVQIDNDTSDRFTILDVFAHDRQGLLYVIAHTIFELGLSVSLAKIATSLDQVLDVFYVTDASGGKVTDPPRRDEIRAHGRSLSGEAPDSQCRHEPPAGRRLPAKCYGLKRHQRAERHDFRGETRAPRVPTPPHAPAGQKRQLQ